MKHFLLLTLFTIFSVELSAQVPGFLGNRWLANAYVETSPVIGYVWGRDRSITDINPRLRLEGTYVLGVGNSVGFYYTRVADKLWLGVNDERRDLGTRENQPDDFAARMRGSHIGLTYRGYNFGGNGSIAPYGKYISFDAGVLFAKVKDPSGTYLPSGKRKIVQHNYYTFGLGFGRQTILNGKYLLDYCLKMSIIGSTLGETSDGPVGNRWNDRISSPARIKALTDFTYAFHIGLGLPVR